MARGQGVRLKKYVMLNLINLFLSLAGFSQKIKNSNYSISVNDWFEYRLFKYLPFAFVYVLLVFPVFSLL